MYVDLNKIHERPAPFSRYTAEALWTAPHISRQMLTYHLSQETDLASRRLGTIEKLVGWLDAEVPLRGKRVVDLGCGPGLYAQALAGRGADVTGIDFSSTSIDYARARAAATGAQIRYRVGNYLDVDLPEAADLIQLIYFDFCVLSPDQRRHLLAKIRKSLKPGGSFLFDFSSLEAFAHLTEQASFGRRLMDGFWSVEDYFAFQNSFKYEDQALSLDQFTICTAGGTWQVFNWLQHFSVDAITAELAENGFTASTVEDLSLLQEGTQPGQQYLTLAQAA